MEYRSAGEAFQHASVLAYQEEVQTLLDREWEDLKAAKTGQHATQSRVKGLLSRAKAERRQGATGSSVASPGLSRKPSGVLSSSEVAQATGTTTKPVSSVWNRITGTSWGQKFVATGLPLKFQALSPWGKVGVGLGIGLVGVALARAALHTLHLGDANTPPPAYQGAYGRIEGMRATRFSTRWVHSDFGSGVRHAQTVRRGVLPMKHRQHGTNVTGFVQNLT